MTTYAYEEIVLHGFDRVGECLIPRRAKRLDGYSVIMRGGQTISLHRVVYGKWFGGIGNGRVIDHICHNRAAALGDCDGWDCFHRACVNPAHLRSVTPAENSRASVLVGKWQADKTQCPKGHPYSKENTYTTKRGHRACRECSRQSARRYYAENRESILLSKKCSKTDM
jgi:hypothetical protein